jgi:HTH-type transcriptional regulator/antitoxin HigA
MAEAAKHEYTPQSVAHPGEIVVDYLESRQWSQRDLARRSGLTPKTISEICSGKASVSPTTALNLEKVFGRPAHFWLNLQRRFDEAAARQEAEAASHHWKDWVAKFPLKELAKYKLLQLEEDPSTRAHSLLAFLGVSSPESWKTVWDASNVAYRQTRHLHANIEAISAWVRATEVLASRINVEEFDEAKLRISLAQLRSLSLQPADKIMEPVENICGAAGVAVVWVPAFKNTGISGCARWLSDNKALVGLSLRYKTDDQLWFTLFHELGHILMHKKRRGFILDNADTDLSDKVIDPEMRKEEEEANRFAADSLIPPSQLAKFIRLGNFSDKAIEQFAIAIGIGPGLVVGRLQHDSLLPSNQGNDLKQKLAIHVLE